MKEELVVAGQGVKRKSCNTLIKGLGGQGHQTQGLLQELRDLPFNFNRSQVLTCKRQLIFTLTLYNVDMRIK